MVAKNSKKRKGFLAVATALLPVATMLLSSGKYVEGGVLTLVAVGLFVGYDYLDDKIKGEPKLPAGIDAELIEEHVGDVADEINERLDERK
jgi:hypothetical protein